MASNTYVERLNVSLVEPRHRRIDVDGLEIFFREAGPPGAPVLLLLHGFPSASHQFRRLIDVLGTRYRVIAPDYPGFGHSEAPPAASAGGSFDYTFDALAAVVEGFVECLGLTHFTMYVFDFGAPVGFRVAEHHPEWIAGLIVQNANAYLEGLSPAAREFTALRRDTPGAVERVRELLTLDATRSQYLTGVADPERVAPDGWILDQWFLELPGRAEIQVDLALDYETNIRRYDAWQSWLRREQPPMLVVWGTGDPFFTEAGARAYLRDVPDAELLLLDTGHFALEDRLHEIAPRVARLVEQVGCPSTGPDG